jgi:hypothetical protein
MSALGSYASRDLFEHSTCRQTDNSSYSGLHDYSSHWLLTSPPQWASQVAENNRTRRQTLLASTLLLAVHIMTTHRHLLLAALSIAFGLTGCLDEVPEGLDDDDYLSEEELAGEGQADDELLIESGGDGEYSLGGLSLCAYRFWAGTCKVRYKYDSDLSNDNLNDRVTSLYNETPYYWLLYNLKDYGGQSICMRPISSTGDLSRLPAGFGGLESWNNKISSAKRMTRDVASCNGRPVFGARY